MKVQPIGYSLILALVGVVLSCNSVLAKEYLSRDDVIILISDDGSTKESTKLRIEIWAKGCLQDFGQLKSKIHNETLELRIPDHRLISTLFKKKLCQFKELRIEVPTGVKRVTLAGDNSEIWPRDAGERVLPPDQQKALDVATKQFLKDFNRADMNRVSTSVSEQGERPLMESCFEVTIIPFDPNIRIIYYLSKKDLSILKRVDN